MAPEKDFAPSVVDLPRTRRLCDARASTARAARPAIGLLAVAHRPDVAARPAPQQDHSARRPAENIVAAT